MHKIILFVRIDYEASELKGVQLLTPIKLDTKVKQCSTSKTFHIWRLQGLRRNTWRCQIVFLVFFKVFHSLVEAIHCIVYKPFGIC